MSAPSPAVRRLVRVVGTLAVVYHLAAITVANMPRQTALGPGVHAPFGTYTALFGLWQSWTMFTTIPIFLDLEARIVARDDEGRETVHGVMLPDLGDYVDDLRVHAFFVRVTYEGRAFAPQAHRYLRAVCRAIERKTGTLPTTVRIDVRAEKLRRLHEVRADGRIAEEEFESFPEVACRE